MASGEAMGAISDAGLIDLSSLPLPALRFMLQQPFEPSGVVEDLGPGFVLAHSPWLGELTAQLTGTSTVAVFYLLPFEDGSGLVMACLDEAFEPLYRLLTGADYGRPASALLAREWPEQYRMLAAGQAQDRRSRMLCVVATPGRRQWVVADDVDDIESAIVGDRLMDLLVASLETCLRAVDFPTALPGLLEVLGGPDRLARRLGAVAGLLGSISSIGSTIEEGVGLDDIAGLGEGLIDVVDAIRRIKD